MFLYCVLYRVYSNKDKRICKVIFITSLYFFYQVLQNCHYDAFKRRSEAARIMSYVFFRIRCIPPPRSARYTHFLPTHASNVRRPEPIRGSSSLMCKSTVTACLHRLPSGRGSGGKQACLVMFLVLRLRLRGCRSFRCSNAGISSRSLYLFEVSTRYASYFKQTFNVSRINGSAHEFPT